MEVSYDFPDNLITEFHFYYANDMIMIFSNQSDIMVADERLW